jgi:cation diffusion facilitator CzcD-associated flavoprotein CzcO
MHDHGEMPRKDKKGFNPHVNRTSNIVHAVIVGAGPYGLSLAAHLREVGVPFRIFGHPMQSWATQMPEGMKLKSDGFASDLYSGSVPFTLEDFCKLTGRPYHHTDIPVAVEDFVAYGQEFARRFVPTLEERNVISIEREGELFHISVEGGDSFLARQVVLATGVSLFQHIPEDLATLPKDLVTHSSEHRTFEQFEGHDVVVMGRGASSLNAAVLLHESGARVTLLTRKHKIHIHTAAKETRRSLYHRLRHPSSPLGTSLRSWLASSMPGILRYLPCQARALLTWKHLGPAGGSVLRGRIENKFPLLLGWSIASAELMEAPNSADRRIKLTLTNPELETREHITSHIIAGTGFRVDLSRYRFLDKRVQSAIRTYNSGAPVLSHHFESSVKGLFLIGPVAHASFGPLLRFAAGAGFAATHVTEKLQRNLARHRPNPRPAFAPLPVRSTID